MAEKTLHNNIGRKISRIRELKNIKQEALAMSLGISQQAVSKIEQSAEVEDEALSKIAKVLGVTPEAIKNFSDEAMVNYFNTFNDSSVNHGPFGNYHCTFNPLDKLMEVIEENKKLHDEKVALLERLLQAEKEKIGLLKTK
jgi:transcriptional regulator with XRE-family HTH domain